MAKAKVKVVQDPDQDTVPAEIIAQSIKAIADSVKRMDAAGLSEKCIRLLLKDASGESMTSVVNVLFALRNLERIYLK